MFQRFVVATSVADAVLSKIGAYEGDHVEFETSREVNLDPWQQGQVGSCGLYTVSESVIFVANVGRYHNKSRSIVRICGSNRQETEAFKDEFLAAQRQHNLNIPC